MKKQMINLNLISKYRNQLFGLAILSIMCFHYSIKISNWLGQDNLVEITIFNYVKYIGSIGVEFFVFMSGMGLYYSFSQNSNIAYFYKKRLKRLFLPYIIVAIIFWGLKDIYILHLGVAHFIKDITFITFFTEGVHTIWYILLMFILYTLFPLIYMFLEIKKLRPLNLIILSAFFIGTAICLFNQNIELYKNIEIALTRVPIFIIGCFMGKTIKENKKIPLVPAIFFSFIMIFIKIYTKNHNFPGWLGRDLDILYALGLLILCILILDALKNWRFLQNSLANIGAYSLELYLVHVTVHKLQYTLHLGISKLNVIWIIIVIGVCTMAVGLNKLCNWMNNTNLFFIHTTSE